MKVIETGGSQCPAVRFISNAACSQSSTVRHVSDRFRLGRHTINIKSRFALVFVENSRARDGCPVFPTGMTSIGMEQDPFGDCFGRQSLDTGAHQMFQTYSFGEAHDAAPASRSNQDVPGSFGAQPDGCSHTHAPDPASAAPATAHSSLTNGLGGLAAGIASDAETVLLGVDFNDMGLPNPFAPPQQGQVERCGLHFTACHFSQHYQRNNRGGGLKNIKCFPSCRTEGHRESSFCGNAVNLVLSLNEMTDPSQSGLTYHCFGQFRCAADLPMCEIGEVLDLVAIERQCASVQDGRREGGLAGHVSKGLFSSVSTPQPSRSRFGSLLITFKPCRWFSWHYGWMGHKSKMDTAHHFRVYAFAVAPDGAATCINAVDSPPFRIFAALRRKVNTRVKAEQENAEEGARCGYK